MKPEVMRYQSFFAVIFRFPLQPLVIAGRVNLGDLEQQRQRIFMTQ
jgi:hypothetical protein